ncbi:Squalene epoxidase [Tilletia horrida]|nr:Squalene epoxidase [Tilletia horrida]
MTVDSAAPITLAPPAPVPTSPQPPPQYDVVVVGAGIVGSALAYALARSGRSVALLERDLSQPDRIVGELLQPAGVHALSRLGLSDALEGIDAVRVRGYQVFYEGNNVPIPYPTRDAHVQPSSDDEEQEQGRSFHHGRFIQSLRACAQKQAGVTVFEATVSELLYSSSAPNVVIGVSATTKQAIAEEGAAPVSTAFEVHAPLTFVADGCFSKFRRTLRGTSSRHTPLIRSHFVGLELTHEPMSSLYAPSPKHPNALPATQGGTAFLPAPEHGHVCLTPSGPVLLYQIGPCETRILIDVPHKGTAPPPNGNGQLDKHIRSNVVPHLPQHAAAAVLAELDKGQRLRSMPNSWLPPSLQGQGKGDSDRQGVILVGDAMNMRHPLTGGGMSVGLWDVVYLTALLGGSAWRPDASAARSTTDEAQLQVSSSAPVKVVADLSNWDSDIRPALRTWHWQRKGLAGVINVLAQALYSLFGADDDDLFILREGCFAYFRLGGECVNGPVRLLSGLAPQPMLLVFHFFSVAILACRLLFTTDLAMRRKRNIEAAKSGTTPSTAPPGVLDYPWLLYRTIHVLWTACIVLFPVIFSELKQNVPDPFKGAKGKLSGSGAPSHKGEDQSKLVATAPLSTLAVGAVVLVVAWRLSQSPGSSGLTGIMAHAQSLRG